MLLWLTLLIAVRFTTACLEYDVAYQGNPMGSNGVGRKAGVENEYDCMKACQDEPKCNFWVWNSPQWRAGQGLCYFKSNNEGRTEKGLQMGRISGPKVGLHIE